MKRVLVVQQYYYPDVSAVAQLLGDLLGRLSGSYAITVLCGSDVRAEGLPPSSRQHGIRIVRIPARFPVKLRGLRVILQALVVHLGVALYILLGPRYDCVVSMTTPPLIGFTVAMALTLRRSRFVYYVEDLYPEILVDSRIIGRSQLAKKVGLFNRITLRRADRVIVIGEYMSRKLRTNYGISPERTEIISNWTSEIPQIEPLPSDDFLLSYSGNLGFAHDFSLFKTFLESMRARRVHYQFVGGGRRFAYVKSLFAKAGENRLSASGYLPRALHGRTLSEANLFILAQSAETVGDILPSKFYSYLAAGRPIIFFGPQRSEIGEAILADGIGAVVEIEDDVKDAVALVDSYMNDRLLYLRTCRNAAEVYRRTGGLDRAVSQFREILDMVNGRKRVQA